MRFSLTLQGVAGCSLEHCEMIQAEPCDSPSCSLAALQTAANIVSEQCCWICHAPMPAMLHCGCSMALA